MTQVLPRRREPSCNAATRLPPSREHWRKVKVVDKPGWVYIMASKRNGTIYTGRTSDLIKRAYQHRERLIEGFTKEHDCRLLVWFADRGSIESARERERQMKKWRRAWKLRKIEATSPDWNDLFSSLA